MTDRPESPRFEDVDWDSITHTRRIRTPERLVLLGSLLVLAVLYAYDTYVAHIYIAFDWQMESHDWLFLLALAILVSYGLVPLYRKRDEVKPVLQRLRKKPLVMVSSVYLFLLFVAAMIWPLFTPNERSRLNPGYQFNPPFGFTSEEHQWCSGSTSGGGLDEVCRGSLRFPLGSTRMGERVDFLVLDGARPAIYIMIIGAMLIVPLATIVGVVAGLRGGYVDKLLMSYVDLQLSIPAILIYFFGYMAYGPSILVFLLAFGLLSWGGLARLVRSEVIQRREHGHVTVAQSLGASHSYIAKHHIIPNITNTLIPAIAQILALLILFEAGIAFIGFYEQGIQSWGATISEGLNAEVESPHLIRAEVPAYNIWWVSTFPALALAFTMMALKLIGDGVRDALDPRGER